MFAPLEYQYLVFLPGAPMRLVLRSSQSTYIIMEKAQGIELGHVWDKITPELRDHTVREWVAIDRLQMQPILGGYGSIFYCGKIHLICALPEIWMNGSS